MHVFWKSTFWKNISMMGEILGCKIAVDPRVVCLGLVHEGVITTEDLYLFIMMLMACEKVTTLKHGIVTVDIYEKMYLMEK